MLNLETDEMEVRIMMKKLMGVMVVLGLALTVVPGIGGHVHDENCGYNPETGKGCVYEIMPANSEHMGL